MTMLSAREKSRFRAFLRSAAETVIIVAGVLLSGLHGSVFGQAESADEPPPRYGRVLVVANSLSPASLELASAYCRQRDLPPANVLRIPFKNEVNISPAACRRKIINSLRERQRDIGYQADYVVLMRGVPYRTGRIATTTAILFNGPENLRPVHGYFQRLESFDSSIPYYGERLMPASIISAYTVEEALSLIKRSDVMYDDPTAAGTFYLCEGVGPRGSRNRQIESAVSQLQSQGLEAIHVENHNIRDRDDVLAQLTGHTGLKLGSNTYLPGSILDNMTSYGGYLLENNSQMSILAFIAHGVCGAYGTVSEPTNSPTRWAAYTFLLSYVRGFGLLESYLQHVRDMKFGTVVGDPLMKPFAKPPRLKARLVDDHSGKNGSVRGEINVQEGRYGEGILHMEAWLDDQHKIWDWSPVLPADTVCRLEVEHNEEKLLVREFKSRQPRTLPDILSEFNETSDNFFDIHRAGRHGSKLLLRWKPKPDHKEEPKCSFSIRTPEGGETKRTYSILKRPIIMHTAILNFGSAAPSEGEAVTINLGEEKVSARCREGESFEDFLARLKQKIESTSLFSQDTQYRVIYNTQKEGEGQRSHQFMIIPTAPMTADRFPIEVSIDQQAGANFAETLTKQDKFWKLRRLGVIGEAVIQPFVPVPRLQQAFEIPGELLAPGAHRLRFFAKTPRGAEVREEIDFFHAGQDTADRPFLNLARTHFNRGEKLVAGLNPDSAAHDSYPLLVVDGRPLHVWPQNTLMGTYTLDTPLLSPGEHEVWVEWIKNDKIPGVTEVRRPLLRSRRQKIWIRRPLDAELEWSPKTLEEGEDMELKFKGPYLRDGLQLVIGHNIVKLKRQSKNKMTFTAKVSSLTPGEYRLILMGNMDRESGFQLAEPLIIGQP